MFSRTSDRIADAARLMAAAAAMAGDPTLLSALKSGPGAYDALKRFLADAPRGWRGSPAISARRPARFSMPRAICP
jgi:hypothetical protein